MSKLRATTMNGTTVRVLGGLAVVGQQQEPRLSPGVRQFIAVLAASGPAGNTREQIAIDLWGKPLPESWRSAIRNRLTATRKALGTDAVTVEADRVSFGQQVHVDSWTLLDLARMRSVDPTESFAFLEGEPLAGIPRSPLVQAHIARIDDAREALVQTQVGNATEPLPADVLSALRAYQRSHTASQIITENTIRAHVLSGDTARARTIVDDSQAASQEDTQPQWLRNLGELLSATPRRRWSDRREQEPVVREASSRDPKCSERSDLFTSAASASDWRLAFEIAMSGLPAAELIGGDPERVALLEAIPINELPESHRFEYSTLMARQLLCVGREHEAREWSKRARVLAETPDQDLVAYITGSIVGDSVVERAPIVLPPSFGEAADRNTSMQSMQVAVMSHLERADFEQAAFLTERFRSMVNESAMPYRRWHMMVLESLLLFVQGELNAALEAANRAFSFGKLSNIVDAEVSFVGQLMNAAWISPHASDAVNIADEYPIAAAHSLGEALQVVFAADDDRRPLADAFAQQFDFDSRSYFNFPTLMVVAPHIDSDDHKKMLMLRLHRRSGTSAIWGCGVHLGPVDRAIARLSADDQERNNYLRSAIDLADRQRTRLWQVVCRLDLAHASGDEESRRQAEELATTPELAELVETYPGLG